MIAIKERYASVEELARRVRDCFPGRPDVAVTFETCMSDTLKRTVRPREDGLVDVITGDIPAMWLRDSACQLTPFIRLAEKDGDIREILTALSLRHAAMILEDPYANAFCVGGAPSIWTADGTDMKDGVWERKYEIDSLCHPVRMAWELWKATGRADHLKEGWHGAMRAILTVFKTEQDHEALSPYRFERKNCRYTDTLSRGGKGALVKGGIGLIWSGFRPSDDACTYGYLIPSNMLACVCLSHMAEIARGVYADEPLALEASSLASRVRAAVEKYGRIPLEGAYAYEVDGFGQYNVMDDANLPSLLSMPYYGYCAADDPAYLATRALVLSSRDPYWFSGKRLRGIGSPHTPPDYVWDIALAMQGLTARDREEQLEMIFMMAENDAGTHMMHEGVHADDPALFTRPWFSWANSMFCELVLRCCGL